MIFISIGTERFEFKRICKYINKLLQQENELFKDMPNKDKIFNKIIVQHGTTKCNISHLKVEAHEFVPFNVFVKNIQDANIVIMHAGVGSFLDTITRGKIPILVPRKPELKEHLDDQQLQVSKVLQKAYNIPIAYSFEQLVEHIKNYDTYKLKIKSHKQPLIDFLDNWVCPK